jgi:hypothetical protein
MITANNMEKFRNSLRSINFDDVLSSTDTQAAYTKFHNSLSILYDNCFPVKTFKKRYTCNKPWLSEGLRQSIKNKNWLFRKYIKNHNDDDFVLYKKYRNKLHHILRIAEREHYQELILNNKNNLRKTWAVMKEVINKKKSSVRVDHFMSNNRKITNNGEISNLFNDFFINIGTSLAQKIPPSNHSALSYMGIPHNKSIFLQPVTRNEVIKLIHDLKTDSSCGWDEFSPKVMKYSHLSLLDPLIHLINLSLAQGIFPDELKLAKVIPIFKSGNLNTFTNYRPISVLPILSKLFERVYYNRLFDFLTQEKLLFNNQFGFRKSHSTQMPLILLTDHILNAIDTGDYVLGVFLDFSKAFDTVDHHILLQKLEHYGIRGVAYNWIKSYLENRKQFVYYNETKSCCKSIKCGVPQGSILGPLLFLIYINDLPTVSQNLVMYMFADDTNVFLKGSNIRDLERIMNHELSLLSEWLKSNKLSLNVSKTHFILFTSPRKKINYEMSLNIDNNEISKVNHTKFLGVVLDSKLSWKDHVSYIKGKISKSIGIIYRAKLNLNKECLISLYYAFVYPYLNYCISVWGGANITTLTPIIMIHKRTIRCIANVPKDTSTLPLFKDFKMLQLTEIYKLHILMFVYKFKKSLLPDIFYNYLIKTVEVHGHNTRQTENYYLPLCRLDITQTGFKFNACKIWNSLPGDTKRMDASIRTFKKHVSDLIQNNKV